MAKIVHYRYKCIGCSVCYEMQPGLWRMSKKDGKAVLLGAGLKKNVFMLPVPAAEIKQTQTVANACPVKIIKIV